GIAGAKVTIVNEEDENKRAVLTDDTGYYSRPYLPAGKYTLIAHKDGYVDRIVKSFPVQFNQKNEIRFPELTLLKVTILGAVVDRLQNALPGATILVAKQGSALPRHTRTNQRGEYGIDDLLTGQYVITTSSSDGPGEGAQSLPIELEEEHVRPSTITLEGVGPEPSPAAQIPMPPATLAQGEKIAGLA